MRLRFVVVLYVAAAVSTPLRAGQRPETRDCRFDRSTLPATVLEAAGAFRKKPRNDRIAEFKTLLVSRVFPSSPTERTGLNSIRYEPSRVNCIMTSHDLRALLGRPSERRRGTRVYRLMVASPQGDEHNASGSDSRCNAVFFIDSGLVTLLAFEGGGCGALTSVLLTVNASAQSAPDLKALLATARSGDQAARLDALATLGSYGPNAAGAVPDLCKMLEDRAVRTDAFTLYATIDVLGEIGTQAKVAIPLLHRIVRDRQVDSVSQAAAMVAIDRIWLHDPDPALRVRGARGLGTSAPTVLPTLRRALSDPDPRVRKAVEEAIHNIESISK